MANDNRFALRLRQLRTERGYSQERLAERSGMSTDGVSNLERALSVPGLDSVELLQRGLDVPIWELLDYMGRDPAPDPERQRLEDVLLRASRALNLDLLAAAVAQIEVLTRVGRKGG